MSFKNAALITFSIIALFTLACDTKPDSVGSYNKITLLLDDEEREEILPHLSAALEREIITPRVEKVFRLDPVDSSNFDRLKSSRTILVAASLESPGPAGDFVRNALSEDARKMIQSGSYWLISKKDTWARNQMLVIATAPTKEALGVQLELGQDALFTLVNESVNERVSDWLYSSLMGEGEQLELEDSIASSYAFAIRVPRYWNWEKGMPSERFIWLRTLEPERWIFVWWTPLDSAMDFSVERWRIVRDSLCAIYYEGDVVSSALAPETTGTFIGNRPAVQIRALWENRNSNLGGAIISFVLSDPETRRLYIVDGALFAPVVRKEPYLRHLEIIARSFRSDVKAFYNERAARK